VIISWWSAGITSAVATKLAIQEFGSEVKSIYFEIGSAHPDNHRFKKECEDWYGQEIEVWSSDKYKDQFDVIEKTSYFNGPAGARCTTELKKKVRLKVEKTLEYEHQVFGFEYSKAEINRALRFKEQYTYSKPIFPLIEKGMNKSECYHFLNEANIKVPEMYNLGYRNNNCIGCVKGGAGYWNKIRKDFPDVFNRMADLEAKKGNSCIRGQFLKDLDPNKGRDQKVIMPDCGNFCDIEFSDLTHPQLEMIFNEPNKIRDMVK